VATTCELGRPRTTPPQGPPAEATDGTEAWCSTGARPNVLWVTRSTLIRGSEVGRALGRGHDLSRRLRLANCHPHSVCQNSFQSLGATSFSGARYACHTSLPRQTAVPACGDGLADPPAPAKPPS